MKVTLRKTESERYNFKAEISTGTMTPSVLHS